MISHSWLFGGDDDDTAKDKASVKVKRIRRKSKKGEQKYGNNKQAGMEEK